jgi:chemotaxis regulatin CheY-phosphate phosphatase CheZ
MSAVYQIAEDEYYEIEEAIAATPKGRAYLRLRDRRARVVGESEMRSFVIGLRDEVHTMLVSVGPRPAPAPDAHVSVLRRELQEMSACIQQTRSQIAALHPNDVGTNRIMVATNELDAIVSACERATSDILNSAERISELAQKIGEGGDVAALASEIDGLTIEILTACSFQDITGQRTTKVVNALRYIEMRVESMIQIWGVDHTDQPAPVPFSAEDKRSDAHLLNGPPLEGGVRQDEVDAMFDNQPSTADAVTAVLGAVAATATATATAAPAVEAPAAETPKPVPVAKPAPAAKPKPPAAPVANKAAAPAKPSPIPVPDSAPAAVASQADIDALFN